MWLYGACLSSADAYLSTWLWDPRDSGLELHIAKYCASTLCSLKSFWTFSMLTTTYTGAEILSFLADAIIFNLFLQPIHHGRETQGDSVYWASMHWKILFSPLLHALFFFNLHTQLNRHEPASIQGMNATRFWSGLQSGRWIVEKRFTDSPASWWTY